jgi:hypothetical protein
LCPAEIVQDPLYRVPLEKQPRYQILQARLGREMNAVVWKVSALQRN